MHAIVSVTISSLVDKLFSLVWRTAKNFECVVVFVLLSYENTSRLVLVGVTLLRHATVTQA